MNVNTYSKIEEKFGGNFRETRMKDTDYQNMNVYWLEFNGATCPICGHSNWCLVNVTGTKVICQRVPNEHPISALNGYLYYLDKNQSVNFDINKIKQVKTYPKAKDRVLDLFYRSVLLAYPLENKHRKDLYERGLTDEMIENHGSRSFGSYYRFSKETNASGLKKEKFTQAKIVYDDKNNKEIKNVWLNMLNNLKHSLHSDYYTQNLWQGVPGFLLKRVTVPGTGQEYASPMFKAPVDGLLVPYFNETNELVGFQTRVDHVLAKPVITQPLPYGEMKVNYDSYSRHYEVTYKVGEKGDFHIIAEGIAENNEVTGEYGGFEYKFKLEAGGKYFWVSSSKLEGGADARVPIQVSYNPQIAKLDPTKKDQDSNELIERKKIVNYSQKPKAVWLTEGGLKAIVATNYLSKRFSQSELDKYGRDVLAVAGVNSYRHFLPMLKKLNVKSVTTAYDMDFLENQQVAESYKQLIKMLKENGYPIYVANWDASKAKGIDDALVAGVEIDFQKL